MINSTFEPDSGDSRVDSLMTEIGNVKLLSISIVNLK